PRPERQQRVWPAMAKQQKTVIFVGGFGKPRDGTEGGQNVACRALVESSLSQFVDWCFIDTTQQSQPPPNMPLRIFAAGGRISRLLWQLWRRPSATLLIFSSFGDLGFAEKGLMCVLGRISRRKVVLSLRSEVK